MFVGLFLLLFLDFDNKGEKNLNNSKKKGNSKDYQAKTGLILIF